MKLPFLLSVLAAASLPNDANALKNGDQFCVEGFVMDRFCIDRGTLLDAPSVVTLEEPNLHSIHCLVDVSSCLNSPFEVLLDPNVEGELFTRGFVLTEDSKNEAISIARGIGSCSTCESGGSQRQGFRAAFVATVIDETSTPVTINGERIIHSNELEDPCASFSSEFPDLQTLEEKLAGGDDGSGTVRPPITFAPNPSGGGRTQLQKQHLIHGSLMLIGWGFLLPTGTIFAKFFKHRPDGLWFKIHRGCQMLGLLFALVGWIIALMNFNVFGDTGYNNYRHGVLGMTTMVLGLLQPLNAFVRPHPPEEGEEPTTTRQVWEVAHKSAGYLALILAVATIGLGTVSLPVLDDQRTFQLAYGAGIGGILLLLIILLNVDKSNYQAANPPTQERARDVEEK